jgi:hypothetical protein
MSLGDRIDFVGGSYEIRGVVDGRYVVRIRNRAKNHEAYRVWTEQDRGAFDKMQQGRADTLDRNAQIYERRLTGVCSGSVLNPTLSKTGRSFSIQRTAVQSPKHTKRLYKRFAGEPSS